MRIVGRDNEKIRHVRHLLTEKGRDEFGEFVAEGIRLVADALESGAEIISLFYDERLRGHETVLRAMALGIPTYELPSELYAKISDTRTPQGITCVVKIPEQSGVITRGRYIALDGVRDPGNVGTVLRTAEAFGFDGALLSEDCASAYSPKTVRSTMGSIFRLPVITCTLTGALDRMKKHGFMLYAALLDEGSRRLCDISFDGDFCIVVGNEAGGVTPAVASLCESVYIPMSGRTQSLNAAVAAAVLMWEANGRRKDVRNG